MGQFTCPLSGVQFKEIEQYKQKPPSKVTDFYISETLMHNFTNAAILVAECLYDYYRTRELVIYDYVGENYDPVEYHIKNFIVTGKDLPPLLIELENVQDPEHWKYQGWASEKILQQWLAHIQSVQQTLDLVCENFSTVIVLYNGSNPLELGFVEEYDQIKATLWCAGPGNTGFAALDRILNGAVNPSGRTTDTFVYDMTQTSWWNNSGKVSYANMDHMPRRV